MDLSVCFKQHKYYIFALEHNFVDLKYMLPLEHNFVDLKYMYMLALENNFVHLSIILFDRLAISDIKLMFPERSAMFQQNI